MDLTLKCFMILEKALLGLTAEPSCDCGKYVEIWNNVFMEYLKDKYTKLAQKNVDTGMGLERITFLLQGKETPFETELFVPIMNKLQELSKNDSISRRNCSRTFRASMMVASDGVKPSNIDRGYILKKINS